MRTKKVESMTNKTAIITGASRGIGRNTAVNLARRGVDITLFTGTFLPVNLSRLITVLFIAAMVSLFLALLAFLREVITATRALRISSSPQPRGNTSAKVVPPLVEE